MAPDVQAAFRVVAAHRRAVDRFWRYPPHTHPLFEFNLVLEGRQRFVVDGRPILQSEGDIVFVRPGVVHASEGSAAGGTLIYFALHFDVDDPAFRSALLGVEQIIWPANGDAATAETAPMRALRSALSDYMAAVVEEADSTAAPHDGGGPRIALLARAMRLFAAVGEWALSARPETAPVRREPEHVLALARTLEDELRRRAVSESSDPVRTCIAAIAGRLGYSPAYCTRVFRRVYGVSPRGYLTGLVVRQAKLWLTDPALSVEDISRRLGYRDPTHFSKQFKRWTGLSPLGYRRLVHRPG
ncbi:MAG: hypothetical protein BLM47_13305 [Candidatus Reconcilbacillus cellulovorans]|uniref:HTH araC/xylS-type domain-containing protein n=1 Tax=Candidatus Reconcilbacillus cellulovorans TaxID=1906605 RepID=A0A2A6DWQ4_9BACL|nr:MAG: hypothetical protein BLM47_13305 [Candidatus Reconcilbacillus cellulovorans]